MKRPHGFGQFIEKHGFHSVYLVTAESFTPIKVGIAEDPIDRLGQLQTSHFVLLPLHRFWWLPGRAISARVERAFKDLFNAQCVHGEWFDLRLPEAESFIETEIRRLGTWGVSEADVIEFMKHRQLRVFDFCRA